MRKEMTMKKWSNQMMADIMLGCLAVAFIGMGIGLVIWIIMEYIRSLL